LHASATVSCTGLYCY